MAKKQINIVRLPKLGHSCSCVHPKRGLYSVFMLAACLLSWLSQFIQLKPLNFCNWCVALWPSRVFFFFFLSFPKGKVFQVWLPLPVSATISQCCLSGATYHSGECCSPFLCLNSGHTGVTMWWSCGGEWSNQCITRDYTGDLSGAFVLQQTVESCKVQRLCSRTKDMFYVGWVLWRNQPLNLQCLNTNGPVQLLCGFPFVFLIFWCFVFPLIVVSFWYLIFSSRPTFQITSSWPTHTVHIRRCILLIFFIF